LLESIKNATKGNFTFNVQTHLKDEAGDVAHWFNSLLGKLHDTFGSIETKLGSFIAHPHRLDDPLAESSNTINELSNIYKFKKAIENDGSKDDIYQRIIYLFEKHFGITNYIIKEVSEDGMVEKIVHTAGEGFCDRISNGSDHDSCRARRTGNMISSDQFPGICLGYTGTAPYFYCLPISFGGKVRLVANITCADEEEFKRVSKIAPHLENYLSEAAPILESKMLMEKLRESSLRDSLTGLYNRKFLDEYIEKAAAQTLRDKSRLGILMIDIDHFKMVNDTYGHDVGDLVLKTVAKTIRENLRESDLVVRYGGEEMMVILHAVSDEVSMMQVAEKIRLKVAENKIKVGSETLIKTISIGGALFPIQANTIWKAVKYADVALYNAKHSGRNKVVLFDSTMWSGDKY
ncbi:MAG: GGDEF domain-containing protein, partial [Campylobacterales bacterium]